MNKKEFIKEIQNKVVKEYQEKISEEKVRYIVDTVFETISEQLIQGEKVTIFGFGTFSTYYLTAREGVMKLYDRAFYMAGRNVPSLRFAKDLKAKVATNSTKMETDNEIQ